MSLKNALPHLTQVKINANLDEFIEKVALEIRACSAVLEEHLSKQQ